MKRVHIVGPPRSGTTLMLELMITGFKFDFFAKQELSVYILPELSRSDVSICSKKPIDHFALADILKWDPDVYFIVMVRDPRDVVVSRHGIDPDIYWANLRQWKNWRKNTRGYAEHKRVIFVKYEDLVDRPDEIQRMIAQWIPFIPTASRFSDFHKVARPSNQSRQAMGALRPVDKQSINNWRNHKPRVAGQLLLHGPISKDLIELGYEEDDKWLDELAGIEKDTRPGRFPDLVQQDYYDEVLEDNASLLASYLKKRGIT